MSSADRLCFHPMCLGTDSEFEAACALESRWLSQAAFMALNSDSAACVDAVNF